MRLLVTRPQPGGDATAARLRAAGHEVVLAPLLATEAIDWEPPARPPAAILLTSAAAARLAGPAAAALLALPAFAVGAATAATARAAGFSDVRDGGGTVQALLDTLAAGGFRRLFHLAGEDRTPVTVPPTLEITTAIVYRARLQPLPALPAVDRMRLDWALLYSARTAAHFAAQIADHGAIGIAVLSPAIAAAAGPGWRAVAIAAAPDEEALLAAIGATCQTAPTRSG